MSLLDTYIDRDIQKLEDEVIELSGFGAFRLLVEDLRSEEEFNTYRIIANRADGKCREIMHKILGNAYSKWYTSKVG